MYIGKVLEKFTCQDWDDVDLEREELALSLIVEDGLPEDFEEIEISAKTAKEIRTVGDIIRFVKNGGKK